MDTAAKRCAGLSASIIVSDPAARVVRASLTRFLHCLRAVRLAWLGGAACMLLLSACATAPWKTGSLWLETTSGGVALPGASCTVSNDSFQRIIITPDTIVVPANGDLRIVCDKAGYQRIEIIQHPAFDTGPGNSSIGIGIGGISGNVGLGVGLNLPLGGQRGGYPPRISIDMRAQ